MLPIGAAIKPAEFQVVHIWSRQTTQRPVNNLHCLSQGSHVGIK
jgi:hypothetical protein